MNKDLIAQAMGEKAQMRQALEHCLNWLPEDCAAACEARAVLALAPGLSGWQEDAMRYREVLKSGIPYSKDRDFSDAETDEIVDKRIADRLAAIPEGIAPHQPNKGNGAPPVFAHRNGVKTHERETEDCNRIACRQGHGSEGAASSDATGTSGAELGAGSRGDEDGRLVTSGLHSEQVQAAPHQPQPEPTSKGEPVSEEIAAMLGERVAFLRDPAVYRGKYWDSMTNEQRKQAFTKLDCGAAGYAKKFWTWRHFDMAAEDIGMASQQRETQEAAELITVTACYFPGTGDAELSWARDGKTFAMTVPVTPEQGNKLASIVWPCINHRAALSAPQEAGKVEAVADERQPSDGDYLRWAEQAGAKVNWDFESASSARVVFLTASQWGRFCDKVRALYLRPSQQALGDADGDAFRKAAELGLTLRFYGGCAQSSMPGTPSAYVVVNSSDRASGMREAVNKAAEDILAAAGGSEK